MNILCLQLKRIGDAILTAPALAALRRAHPRAHITLVLHGLSGALEPAFVAADEVLVYAPGRANLGLWTRVITGGWNACYDFTGTDRSALMVRMARADRAFGFRRFVEKRSWRVPGYSDLIDASVRVLHTVDFHLALTGLVAPDGTGFALPVGPATTITGLPAGDFCVVHPGTARAEKYWRPDRWAAVMARLPFPVVLTGSTMDPEERAHLAAIRDALDPAAVRVHDLSGALSLRQLAEVISRARLVLSVDSAAMHLAAMASRPQVALFGPTNPFHWRPRHPAARVLLASGEPADTVGPRHTAAPMDALSTEAVLAAIDGLFDPKTGGKFPDAGSRPS
ncbi:MAG: glycosyltransferase family 9 protein [Verrucomicrobiales bacterium]